MQILMIKILMSFLSMCLTMAGCASGAKGVESLSAAEFEALLARDAAVQLVDVRRASEYASGHIGEALLIDVMAPNFTERAAKELDPQRPVAVYCRSGKRSLRAAQLLREAGFTKVYNLKTGYLGWEKYQAGK